MKRMYCIGMGPGNPELLSCQAKELLAQAELIIGAERLLDSVTDTTALKVCAVHPKGIRTAIEEHESAGTICCIFSGDLGSYSGFTQLSKLLESEYQIEAIPGISSVQYFAAKLHESWADWRIVSAHGKELNIAAELQFGQDLFVLLDAQNNAAALASELVTNGYADAEIAVGERLSYKDELITKGSAAEIAEQSFHDLSVLRIRAISSSQISSRDEDFERAKVPMTKQEIRAIIRSKLNLKNDSVVFDIGSGSAAVSVDLGLSLPKGKVYAIEHKTEAYELGLVNINKFGLSQVEAVFGRASEVIPTLEAPDAAFIGGSNHEMDLIVEEILKSNPQARIVVSALTFESLEETRQIFKAHKFSEIEVIQVSISRSAELGEYQYLKPLNPIFIISGNS